MVTAPSVTTLLLILASGADRVVTDHDRRARGVQPQDVDFLFFFLCGFTSLSA